MSSSDLRVIVLHANPFKSFVRALRDDQERVIKLESELAELIRNSDESVVVFPAFAAVG